MTINRVRGEWKRTAGPRGAESYSGAVDDARLTRFRDAALAYINVVKDTFKDDVKYAEFLQILKDFKENRVERVGAIYRIHVLFEGDQELILGFNTLFSRIMQSLEEDTEQPVDVEESMSSPRFRRPAYMNTQGIKRTRKKVGTKIRTLALLSGLRRRRRISKGVLLKLGSASISC